MSPFLLSQLLVGVAILLDIASFQFRQRRHILLCLCVSTLLTALHFLLLHHWTAAGLMLLASSRFALSIRTTSPRWQWLFVVLGLGVMAATWGGLPSLLSGLGSTIQTIAAFRPCDRQLRLTMLLGISFWLAHNLLVGSPMAVAMESLFILSNLVGYWRHYGVPFSDRRPRPRAAAPKREAA
ncbi:YgjV family protein [Ferrimonas sediminicola]|uniref:YgjV family protein n=1 Tax=Ferrimonas sediminicola TaxID=2569538 RepID=A0A4V5NVI1_9GAMM|nr:YgjV family protein [Ferrimonas sediminicola]TKB50623.1 YgjV family protein [Ferrimonas sediminicola]